MTVTLYKYCGDSDQIMRTKINLRVKKWFFFSLWALTPFPSRRGFIKQLISIISTPRTVVLIVDLFRHVLRAALGAAAIYNRIVY